MVSIHLLLWFLKKRSIKRKVPNYSYKRLYRMPFTKKNYKDWNDEDAPKPVRTLQVPVYKIILILLWLSLSF